MMEKRSALIVSEKSNCHRHDERVRVSFFAIVLRNPKNHHTIVKKNETCYSKYLKYWISCYSLRKCKYLNIKHLPRRPITISVAPKTKLSR